MSDFSRRDVLKAGVATTAAAVGAGLMPETAQAAWTNQPEPNASLRVLRWKQFVEGDIASFMASTKKFTEKTGIKIRVDSESWEDVRPKAAVAANVGAGPDIIIDTNDDPHQYPDKLVDLTDLAEYFDKKYGWYDVCKAYGKRGNRWIGLPMGAAGNAITYRMSHVKAAGFDGIPKDTDGFL